VQFRYFEEIASGDAYEGRRDLGDTLPGDGRRYKGRGPIQLTGRANYRDYGKVLDLPLEQNPTLAAQPYVGFRIAGAFWVKNGCNELADRKLFGAITQRINGGQNGRASRELFYSRALRALATVAPDLGDQVTISVNGAAAPNVPAFLREDHVQAAIRPLATLLGWSVVGVTPDTVALAKPGALVRLPYSNEGGTGYVAVRDLTQLDSSIGFEFDASANTLNLAIGQ